MDPKSIVVLIVVSSLSNCNINNIDRINTSQTKMPNMEYCQTLAGMLDPIKGQSAFCIEVK